ncbi:hypothetical protein [Paracoccus sp. IB05]|uniref:hypothetical protein n=1 Tax=Paracoccus sp. IB05 TaxID=2779367 RepID=UPI0018E7D47D|nr:hypothetical protein [Paracoccus sp. IB05]MBJ2154111.1 hypothetical protein [Paracoccus sp. IB05]
MLEAFGSMLGYTLGSGDSVPDISWGAESIIRQQCQDFEFIRTALRSRFEALRDGTIRVKGINEVAKIMALSPDKVAQVLQFAVGINARPKKVAAHG